MSSNDANNSQVQAVNDGKSWDHSGSFFNYPAPGSPEASHVQSRDYEKTPSQQIVKNDENERMDPPTPSPLEKERAQLRMLMASATDAWIQSQTSLQSKSMHEDITINTSNRTANIPSTDSSLKKSTLFNANTRQENIVFISNPNTTALIEPDDIFSVEQEPGNCKFDLALPDLSESPKLSMDESHQVSDDSIDESTLNSDCDSILDSDRDGGDNKDDDNDDDDILSKESDGDRMEDDATIESTTIDMVSKNVATSMPSRLSKDRFKQPAQKTKEMVERRRMITMSKDQVKDMTPQQTVFRGSGEQSIKDANLKGTVDKVEDTHSSHNSSRKGMEFFSKFQKKNDCLGGEISTLRSDNEALEHKLKVLKDERNDLVSQLATANAKNEFNESRLKEQTRSNKISIKELEGARRETIKATSSMQKGREKIEADLAKVKAELANVKQVHAQQVSKLENEIIDIQKQSAKEKDVLEQEIIMQKQKQDSQNRRMDEMRRLSQAAHQKQIAKLVDVIDNGHCKKQDEVIKISAELMAIRKEKDEEIKMLQQEIRALRASGSTNSKSIRAALDHRTMQYQIQKEAMLRSKRSAQFDSVFQRLQALTTQTCVLPSQTTRFNIGSLVEHQERGQQMNQLLDTIRDIFQTERAFQNRTSTASLSLIEQYVAATEPNRTILDLNDRLMEAELQVCRLEEELKDAKQHCKRCIIRDSASNCRRSKVIGRDAHPNELY